MSRKVAILGAAALPVGRYQVPADAEIQALEQELLAKVTLDAVRDAGIAKTEIGALVFTSCTEYTRQLYFATFMANYLRLPCEGTIIEVLGNGMTGGHAFDVAADQVRLGKAEVALALGINMETAVPAPRHMLSTVRATGDVDFHSPFGFTPISWYAMDAVRYMHEYGVSRALLAEIAVKNRRHAAHNPLAQFRSPITVEDVLAQRFIVEPLGLYEVPPRSDGAACLVLASEAFARASGRPYVLLRGRGFHHEGAHQISEVPGDMTAFAAARRAGELCFEAAGVGPGDVDIAELYAPCTIVEALVTEALDLVPRGTAPAAARSGETAAGGRIPVNLSGGLLSRGHPPFVTPLYDLYELVTQLRGQAGVRQARGARLALHCCELGNYNAALVHVLEGCP